MVWIWLMLKILRFKLDGNNPKISKDIYRETEEQQVKDDFLLISNKNYIDCTYLLNWIHMLYKLNLENEEFNKYIRSIYLSYPLLTINHPLNNF